MSLNSEAALRAALETHLAETVVATTGPRSDLGATAAGYGRAAGSFVADGFRVGDTVRPVGFADGRQGIVLALSDAVLVVDRAVVAEAAGPQRALEVVFPERRRFEGQPFVRPRDKPWLRASLRPAQAVPVAFGAGGVLRQEGSFVVELFEPADAGRGLARLERLAAALRQRFAYGLRLGNGVRLGESRRGAVAEAADFLSLAMSIQWSRDTDQGGRP